MHEMNEGLRCDASAQTETRGMIDTRNENENSNEGGGVAEEIVQLDVCLLVDLDEALLGPD